MSGSPLEHLLALPQQLAYGAQLLHDDGAEMHAASGAIAQYAHWQHCDTHVWAAVLEQLGLGAGEAPGDATGDADGDGAGPGLGDGATVPPTRQDANGTQSAQLVGAYAQNAWVGSPMHDAYGPHVDAHAATADDVLLQYELDAQQPT